MTRLKDLLEPDYAWILTNPDGVPYNAMPVEFGRSPFEDMNRFGSFTLNLAPLTGPTVPRRFVATDPRNVSVEITWVHAQDRISLPANDQAFLDWPN